MDSIVPQNTSPSNLAPKTTFIYRLDDPETGETRYVGKTNDPKKRLRGHIRDARRERYHKGYWITNLLARGLKPLMVIIEEVPFEIWRERELYWIHFYLEHGHPLTNTYFGSEGTGIIPPETRAKLSAVKKGKKAPPGTGAKISAANKGRTRSPEEIAKSSAALRGRTFSQEAKDKLAAASTGKTHTPETKAKLSAISLGKKHTPEAIAKMSAAKTGVKRKPFKRDNGRRGKPMSPESKAKLAASKRGKKRSPEIVAKVASARWKKSLMKGYSPDTPTLWDQLT